MFVKVNNEILNIGNASDVIYIEEDSETRECYRVISKSWPKSTVIEEYTSLNEATIALQQIINYVCHMDGGQPQYLLSQSGMDLVNLNQVVSIKPFSEPKKGKPVWILANLRSGAVHLVAEYDYEDYEEKLEKLLKSLHSEDPIIKVN